MSIARSLKDADGVDLAFYKDLHPPLSDFKSDILDGLSRPQKSISPKYLYDRAGSALFDEITRQPEYYPTRTELALLDTLGAQLTALAGPGAVVIEPGAGSSIKVRKLIDALDHPACYVGMDISGEHVKAACASLSADYPRLPVGAVCHDFTAPLEMAALDLPPGKRIIFFPGSTIGNFDLSDALGVLKNFHSWLRPGDALFIGADLRKDASILEAAYDDAARITAAFNYNLVRRINRELDGSLNLDRLTYKAHWNPYRSRVEMFLVATQDQCFTVAGKTFTLRESETIHTENSHKFTPGTFIDLAARAGFISKQVWVHEKTPYSLHWLECCEKT
ncbi:L-histidine N(alpha)-methyltransferase [Woodsholea maritima]|uniref:L-histidine N(alpha)-methyltransferase n=1 Tax=Woodsholea maritima TaxID=240237 RepID=UPI000377FACE|nr:L-histidine N(alpha)-methyltransferase [Woodsholea maritima]